MTAIVTDISEYIKAKATQDAANIVALSSFSDGQLSSRLVVVERLAAGVTNIDTMPAFVRDNLFPGGYDPSQPRDNIDSLRAEIERREGSTT